MIARLDRLVLKAVVPAILLTWVVFVAIDTLGALLNELDEIGTGEYDVKHLLQFLLLTAPRRAYQMFSTAAVVGTMLGLGALAARSELIALQASGASKLRIALSGMLSVGGLLALALFLGEWIGPRADRMASDLVAKAKAEGIAFAGSGLWLRDGPAVWNAKRMSIAGPGQLELWEVWRYQFDEDARLVEVIRAERAVYQGDRFDLFALSRDQLGHVQVDSAMLDRLDLETRLDPGLIEAYTLKPRQQSTRDLWETVRYARVNQLDALAFESAFWYRACYPLIALALAFAATPFVFGNLRSGSQGQRLLIGMTLGIGFFFAHRTLINLAETERGGLLLVNILPPLLLIVLTLWALRRPARG